MKQKTKTENLINYDFDTSWSDNESDKESDNESDNESHNDESNDYLIEN